MGEIDLGGPARRALKAGAVAIPLPGGIAAAERAAQQAPEAGRLDPLAPLRPLGLHDPGLRRIDGEIEALRRPEVLQHRPDLLDRLVDDDPADVAVAHDPGALTLRHHLVAARGGVARGGAL